MSNFYSFSSEGEFYELTCKGGYSVKLVRDALVDIELNGIPLSASLHSIFNKLEYRQMVQNILQNVSKSQLNNKNSFLGSNSH